MSRALAVALVAAAGLAPAPARAASLELSPGTPGVTGEQVGVMARGEVVPRRVNTLGPAVAVLLVRASAECPTNPPLQTGQAIDPPEEDTYDPDQPQPFSTGIWVLAPTRPGAYHACGYLLEDDDGDYNSLPPITARAVTMVTVRRGPPRVRVSFPRVVRRGRPAQLQVTYDARSASNGFRLVAAFLRAGTCSHLPEQLVRDDRFVLWRDLRFDQPPQGVVTQAVVLRSTIAHGRVCVWLDRRGHIAASGVYVDLAQTRFRTR